MFHSRTALVKHLISAEHRCLTVLCPWCFGKNKTFTRVSDLEIHMKTSHQDLTIPKDRFSRANGFYFSVYPEDYARTVDTVQAYESDAAYDVRKAIRNWAEGFGDRKERIEKWNKGWKAGLRLSEERSKSKEQLDTRRVVEKEAKGATEETRQGSGKAGRTGSGGKKRKEIDRHEEERTVKQGRVSEKADELENYRDDIEVGDGIGEEQEESRPTVEAEETSERGNDIEGNDRSEVGLTGDGFRTDKDSEYEKRIDNSGAYQDERTKQVREEEISETKSESSCSGSSSSSDSISVVTGKGDSLRARAYRILERGAMPLCPPAKRDWNSVRQVDLELNNQHLLWPPTNWRALTPDQKLMAHEYVAVLLENRSSKEFPVISRKTLLDKYAFFTLDGERKPQEEEDEGDKIEAKIRQYNFCYVMKVARGEVTGNKTSWNIIKSLENADRWTDTDQILTELDNGNIKIKM